jgi:hypothetical protein
LNTTVFQEVTQMLMDVFAVHEEKTRHK